MAAVTHAKVKGKAKADTAILDDPSINLHHLARADPRIPEGTGVRVKKKARSRANSDDEVCFHSIAFCSSYIMD